MGPRRRCPDLVHTSTPPHLLEQRAVADHLRVAPAAGVQTPFTRPHPRTSTSSGQSLITCVSAPLPMSRPSSHVHTSAPPRAADSR
eukprot:359748-Chlamydomonas_euryale.AAC.1